MGRTLRGATKEEDEGEGRRVMEEVKTKRKEGTLAAKVKQRRDAGMQGRAQRRETEREAGRGDADGGTDPRER